VTAGDLRPALARCDFGVRGGAFFAPGPPAGDHRPPRSARAVLRPSGERAREDRMNPSRSWSWRGDDLAGPWCATCSAAPHRVLVAALDTRLVCRCSRKYPARQADGWTGRQRRPRAPDGRGGRGGLAPAGDVEPARGAHGPGPAPAVRQHQLRVPGDVGPGRGGPARGRADAGRDRPGPRHRPHERGAHHPRPARAGRGGVDQL
jgi:hypothetical protein